MSSDVNATPTTTQAEQRLHEVEALLGPKPDLASAESGAVLALVGIVITPLVVLLVRRIFPGRNVVFARWGFSHVVLLIATFFAVGLLTSFFGPRGQEDVIWDLARNSIAFGSCCAVLVWFAIRLDPEGWRCLGLWRGRHLSAFVAGLAAFVLLAPAIFGVAQLSTWLIQYTHLGTGQQDVALRLASVEPNQRWLAFLFGALLQPLWEELLFRVFLQPLFVQNFRERAGITMTSIVFAALHGVDSFLPIFVLSLVLGSVMLRTQRLAAVWGIHALFNGLQLWAVYSAIDHVGRTHS